MKRRASILLLTALLTVITVSCGDTTVPPPEQTTQSAPDTAAGSITSGVPSDLNLNGLGINVWTPTDTVYTALSPEQTGDVLDDAVFALNRKVEEKLNCKLNVFDSGVAQGDCSTVIQKLLLADDTTYDLFNPTEWSGAKLVSQRLFLNIADAPYLSLDEDWWDRDYMSAMTVGNDSLYTLVGDCTLDRTRFLNCVYYNRTMYEKFYSDADAMYEVVDSGKWTYDYIKKVGKDVYSDLNSDQKPDINDRMALCVNWNGNINALYYCSDAMITDRDASGVPEIVMGRERNADVFLKLYDLVMNSEGVVYDTNSDTTFNLPIFRNGLTMYLGGFLHFADRLRDMPDDYGVIPLPKADEEQKDYISMVHQAERFMALPINCQKTGAVCALLEEMAFTGHNELLPVYYDTVLKDKYVRDSESARMLDLIRDNVRADIGYIFAGDFANIAYIPRSLFKEGSDGFASAFAGLEAGAKEKSAALIALFGNK